MIDVQNNIVYFGYGDVIVNNRTIGLCFRALDTQVEIGHIISQEYLYNNNIEFSTDYINLFLRDLQEMQTLENLLKQIDGRNFAKFTFKDVTLDFSRYNPKSVETVLDNLEVVKCNLLQTVAC